MARPKLPAPTDDTPRLSRTTYRMTYDVMLGPTRLGEVRRTGHGWYASYRGHGVFQVGLHGNQVHWSKESALAAIATAHAEAVDHPAVGRYYDAMEAIRQVARLIESAQRGARLGLLGAEPEHAGDDLAVAIQRLQLGRELLATAARPAGMVDGRQIY